MKPIQEDIKTSADWIAKALSSSGYNADFSANSLWEIDRFFDENSKNGTAKSNGLLAKDLGSRLFSLGGYIGEVLRRNLGGEWHGDDNDPEAEINIELRFSSSSICWPVQRVMKRYKNGSEDGIVAYGLALGLTIGEKPIPPKKSILRRILGR